MSEALKARHTEFLKRACEFLKKQGRKAQAYNTGACVYRGEDGVMCGVGALIPDSAWEKDANMAAVSYVTSTLFHDRVVTNEGESMKLEALGRMLFNAGFTMEDVNFLRALQEAHDFSSEDRAAFWCDFRIEAQRVARLFDLDASVIPL